MLVAEELCISSASQKVFISPQSMSAHIKRLEQDYSALYAQTQDEFDSRGTDPL